MSVVPSRALVVKGTAAFHPCAASRDTSAFSSVRSTRPVAASRSTVTGGVAMVL
jgi:hypothetical protein